MPTGKRVLLLVLSPILPFLLFALAFDYGVVKTVGSAGSVKQVLKDSGLYSSIVPSLLKQSGPIETSVGSISTQDSLVSDAVSKAVPADAVQKNVESAIDNIYAWLDGTTPQPTFNISLAGSQSAFAKNLADEVQQKLATLPTCTTAYTAGAFDALNATCIPPGVTAAAAAQRLQTDLNNGGGLDQANLNAADLKGNTPGKSVFSDQLKNAPQQYQRLKKTPLILAILSILTAAGLVWLRPTWQGGMKHVGLSILVVGLMMLVFSWVFNAALTKKVIPNLKVDNSGLQTNLRQGLTDLSAKLEHNYWLFGSIYTAVGAAMFAAPILYGKRSAAAGPAATAETQGETTEAKTSEKPAKKNV